MLKSKPMTPERSAKRVARYNELKKRSKEELLAIYSRSCRCHCMNLKDTKDDMIHAIIDDERI